MDWFKGQFTGKTHISWENRWFPVDFPLNRSIELIIPWPTEKSQEARLGEPKGDLDDLCHLT